MGHMVLAWRSTSERAARLALAFFFGTTSSNGSPGSSGSAGSGLGFALGFALALALGSALGLGSALALAFPLGFFDYLLHFFLRALLRFFLWLLTGGHQDCFDRHAFLFD